MSGWYAFPSDGTHWKKKKIKPSACKGKLRRMKLIRVVQANATG